MKQLVLLSLFVLAAALTNAQAADPRFPWAFDMTPDQVKAQENFGPYKEFSNGDLETYKGVFNGTEENFQFFFEDNRLRRIGVYLYEGPNVGAAAEKWLTLFDTLNRDFGDTETPSNELSTNSSAAQRTEFKTRAGTIASQPGKSQMAPTKQPPDARVFASFWGADFQGQRIYYVVLYFDRPPNNHMQRAGSQ